VIDSGNFKLPFEKVEFFLDRGVPPMLGITDVEELTSKYLRDSIYGAGGCKLKTG